MQVSGTSPFGDLGNCGNFPGVVAGTGTPLQVDIVRNGSLHHRLEATTPFEGRWREAVDANEGGVYYRVIVRATRAAYLVSNPIFLQRKP